MRNLMKSKFSKIALETFGASLWHVRELCGICNHMESIKANINSPNVKSES